ncbi:MAG: hypothetical protein QM715_17895 [Nibricoccus sp.]
MEKQALREAQNALDRHGADHFRNLQLARLKILGGTDLNALAHATPGKRLEDKSLHLGRRWFLIGLNTSRPDI